MGRLCATYDLQFDPTSITLSIDRFFGGAGFGDLTVL
jgi:hypothetical protein